MGVTSEGNRSLYLRGTAQAIINLTTAIPTCRNDDVRREIPGVRRFECRHLRTKTPCHIGGLCRSCCASPFDRRCHVRCSHAPQSKRRTRDKSRTSRQCTVPFKNYKARHAAVPAWIRFHLPTADSSKASRHHPGISISSDKLHTGLSAPDVFQSRRSRHSPPPGFGPPTGLLPADGRLRPEFWYDEIHRTPQAVRQRSVHPGNS